MKLSRNASFLFFFVFLLVFFSVNGEKEQFIFLNATNITNETFDDVSSLLYFCNSLADCISTYDSGYFYGAPLKTTTITGKVYTLYVHSSLNKSVSHDMSIVKILACVRAERDYSTYLYTPCYIDFGKITNGVFERLGYYTLRYCEDYFPYDSFETVCEDVTDFYNITSLNSSTCGFAVKYTSVSGNDYRDYTVDWVFFNVTYIPLQFLSWGTEKKSVMYGKEAKIYAKWQITNISQAYLFANFSGAFEKYPLESSQNWTNFSVVYLLNTSPLGTNVFPVSHPGRYEISSVTVYDPKGGYNSTFPPITLSIFGWAKVSEIKVNDSYVYPGESVKVTCRVVDANTSAAIQNYNVSFYLNGSYVGSALSDAYGFASFEIPIPSTGIYKISCNISDAPNLFYNASEKRESEISVTSLNLSLSKPLLNVTNVNYGSGVEIRVNVTNASYVRDFIANITFFNISNCKLKKAWVIKKLKIEKCFSPALCEGKLIVSPERSGPYEVFISVDANSPYGNATTNANFQVSYGFSQQRFLLPYYFVLQNQTFNITAKVEATNGDVWYVNTTLGIEGQESMNLTNGESFSKIIEAVPNGSSCYAAWSAYSNATGLVRMTLYTSPLNGTGSYFSESFEVIPAKINEAPNISFTPRFSYIDGNVLIFANIIGNATPCKVNVTVKEPYTQRLVNFSITKAVSLPPQECGIVFEKGNIASLEKGAKVSASYNNLTSIWAIDGDNTTAWSSGIPAHINITFARPDYAIEKIEIRWQRIVTQNVNASIYYVDPSGVLHTFVRDIEVPDIINETVFTDFRPFKAGMIIINFTGAVSIYEVRIYPTIPRSDNCYVFGLNFTRGNISLSGNYSVFVKLQTKTGNVLYLNPSWFFIKYGEPKITISSLTPQNMLLGKPENYTITITAYRGDLRNYTVVWNSSEQKYLNITPEESFEKFFDFLANGNSIEFTWSINATAFPAGYENYTVNTSVKAFSTTGKGENATTNFSITIFPEDNEAPVIHGVWFEIFGRKTNITNVNFTFHVFANVSDNIWVKLVNASIIYPNGENRSVTFEKVNSTLWVFVFSDPLTLNETGNYSIKVEAMDLNFNITKFTWKNFTVTNMLKFNVSSPLLLNRGEKLNVSILDINGNLLKNASYSANIMCENYTENFTGKGGNVVANITSFMPAGKCLLRINASYLGNGGATNITFTVSDKLKLNIIAPAELGVFEPGSAISGVELPRIKVYGVREDVEKTINVNVSVNCLNSSYVNHTFSLDYGACGIFPQTFSFKNCKSLCYAPNSYGKVFYITFYARDKFNNTGIAYVKLLTRSLSPKPTSSGQSTGGGGGGVYTPPAGSAPQQAICNCTEWENVGCEIGPCGEGEMYQERTCTPAECAKEWRCVKYPACVKKVSFELITPNTTLSIVKGIPKTFFVTLVNTGEENITGKIRIRGEVCIVVNYSGMQTLEQQESKTINFTVYCPLNITETEEEIRLSVEAKGIIKEGIVDLLIRNHPVAIKLKTLIDEWDRLRDLEQELSGLGILDKETQSQFRDIIKLYKKAREEIKKDNLTALKEVTNRIEEMLPALKSKLLEVEENKTYLLLTKSIKENIHFIFLGIIIAIYLTYLFSQVFKPYFRLRKMLNSLREKEKYLIRARIETQKQFFMRKIDEKTFRELMIKRQHEILTVRARMKTITEEMSMLPSKAWNIKYMFSWIRELFSKAVKTIYRSVKYRFTWKGF